MKKAYCYLMASSDEAEHYPFFSAQEGLELVYECADADKTYRIFRFTEDAIPAMQAHQSKTQGLFELLFTDGKFYRVKPDGLEQIKTIKKRYSPRYLKRYLNRALRVFRIAKRIHARDKRRAKKLTQDTIQTRPLIGRKFYFQQTGKLYRFRLHPAKGTDKQPLIVFLHGAGAPGFDNIRPLWEVSGTAWRLWRAKKNCGILVPQLGYDEKYNCAEFSDMLWALIQSVKQKYGNVDFSRIYLIGISYGGHSVIYEALRHPERFAGIIPTVAWIYEKNPEYNYVDAGKDRYHMPMGEEDLRLLKETPMWLACSQIELSGNEFLYKGLQALGADVRFTREDKHGHGMGWFFLWKEPWEEWLWEKRKSL